jgi:hypothetical protein
MSLPSLHDVFARLPDPRSRHGKRHPLVSVLCLVALGLILGRKSLEAIAKLRRDYGPGLILALGFRTGKGPSADTLGRLLGRLDPGALEEALAAWVRPRLPGGVTRVCLDGKTLKGSRDGEIPGQHLLAAYAPEANAVLGQMRVDAKTNEHKAALQLLGVLPLDGKVVSGDAIFAQREVAEKVRDSGGDYLLTVKGNQPGLEEDIRTALHGDAGFSPLPAAAEA